MIDEGETMSSPAVLFYTSDFITGTLFMSNEEVGAYIRILCMQHQKGHLSKEDIQKICKNETIFLQILSHFKKDRKGLYYNERMEYESNKRSKFVESRANNRRKKEKTSEKDMNNISKTSEKDMENENENINKNENINIIKEIINYLNLRIGSNYKYTTKATQKLINARLKDGYSLENFKVVIDKKVDEWLDTDMAQYLRPSTLFAGKFDEYLNQQGKKKEITTSDIAKNMNWEEFFNE